MVRAFLGDGDEDFAGGAVGEEADGDEAFLLADAELVGEGLALVGHVASMRRFAGRGEGVVRRRGDAGFAVGDVGEDLTGAGAVAVDGDAFAAFVVGEQVGGGDVVLTGAAGEVDGLADGVVDVALEGGLHAHVPFGGDLVGGDEAAFGGVGDVVALLEAAAGGEVVDEVLGVEALLARDGLEHGVDLGEAHGLGGALGVEEVLAGEGEREGGLDAAGAVGDDAEGAGGRDGRAGGVAQGDDGACGRGAGVGGTSPPGPLSLRGEGESSWSDDEGPSDSVWSVCSDAPLARPSRASG